MSREKHDPAGAQLSGGDSSPCYVGCQHALKKAAHCSPAREEGPWHGWAAGTGSQELIEVSAGTGREERGAIPSTRGRREHMWHGPDPALVLVLVL